MTLREEVLKQAGLLIEEDAKKIYELTITEPSTDKYGNSYDIRKIYYFSTPEKAKKFNEKLKSNHPIKEYPYDSIMTDDFPRAIIPGLIDKCKPWVVKRDD